MIRLWYTQLIILPLLKAQSQSVCGDCKLDYLSEACDDCNTLDNDGCSSTCLVEQGFMCPYNGTLSICYELCGDGINTSYQCDDGNTLSGDGCSSICTIEQGFSCPKQGGPCTELCDGDWKYVLPCDERTACCARDCSRIALGCECSPEIGGCREICGSGLRLGVSVKECEDGDAGSLDNHRMDGCSSECKVEQGFICPFIGKCKEICGQGTFDHYQYPCDDGNNSLHTIIEFTQINNFDGDGCSKDCQLETGWSCTGGTPISHDACNELCGDGLNLGHYHCDDGNSESGDGCSSTCTVEQGYSCTGKFPDVCTEICGDGLNLGYFECDDGNTEDGDGCSSKCKVESGFQCMGGSKDRRDICNENCGNGKRLNLDQFTVKHLETCDDKNVLSNDGCSSLCEVEQGWTCTYSPSQQRDRCVEICGDGLNRGQYECDDGNNEDGDGCDSKCKVETGYQCQQRQGMSDQCTEICGDGIFLGEFECDDGNNENGDGCSNMCAIEKGWFCTSAAPSNCSLLPQPYITSVAITREKMLGISFSEPIIYPSHKWIIMQVFGLRINESVNYTIQDEQKTQLVLNLMINQQEYESNLNTLQVLFTQNPLSALTTRPLINTTFSLTLNTQSSFLNPVCDEPWLRLVFSISLIANVIISLVYKLNYQQTYFVESLIGIQIWLKSNEIDDLEIPTCQRNYAYHISMVGFRYVNRVVNQFPILEDTFLMETMSTWLIILLWIAPLPLKKQTGLKHRHIGNPVATILNISYFTLAHYSILEITQSHEAHWYLTISNVYSYLTIVIFVAGLPAFILLIQRDLQQFFILLIRLGLAVSLVFAKNQLYIYIAISSLHLLIHPTLICVLSFAALSTQLGNEQFSRASREKQHILSLLAIISLIGVNMVSILTPVMDRVEWKILFRKEVQSNNETESGKQEQNMQEIVDEMNSQKVEVPSQNINE